MHWVYQLQTLPIVCVILLEYINKSQVNAHIEYVLTFTYIHTFHTLARVGLGRAKVPVQNGPVDVDSEAPVHLNYTDKLHKLRSCFECQQLWAGSPFDAHTKKEKDKQTKTQRHIHRDRERKRDRDKQTDRKIETERDKDKETETEKERDRVRDKDKEREIRQRDREKETNKQTDRQTERDRDRAEEPSKKGE